MNHKNLEAMLIALVCMVIIVLCILMAQPAAACEWTPRQQEIHAIADRLRLAWVMDDDPAIKSLEAEWWNEENSKVWREDVPLSAELQKSLLKVCDETGVDPLLALGLIETESGFQPDIVSPWGDYGLMQLNHNYFPTDVTPEENMRMGLKLLASNIERYGTVDAALTAYNRGHDDGTRSYAGVVLRNAAKWGYEA